MKKTRLLLVDDKVEVREGLKTMIELSENTEVVGAAGEGSEALKLAEECTPDVVLMDIRMPIMDGLEATRLIKLARPEIRVIALTLYQSYREDALAAGAEAVLVKGCSIRELLNAIRR